MKIFLSLLTAYLALWALAAGCSAVSVSAEGAVLMEASTGAVLWEKNAGEHLPMASTTKIMTALVALETGGLDRPVVIPPSAVGIEGSSIYLRAGETLTMEELLYAVLLESANDAATAVALATSGSLEAFSDAMNEKAAEIGLTDTHFTNPHGLDDENHYTTALDLARLASYALKNSTFAKIVATTKRIIPLNGEEGVRVLLNHNKMLRLYDGAVGVKTGFTRHSGRCLVSAAKRDDLTLIAVTLAAPDDWRDHTALLDYGFSVYQAVSLAQPGDFRLEIPVAGGTAESCTASVHEAYSLALPLGHGTITSVLEAPHLLFAPLQTGDRLGCVRFYCDGREIGCIPLYSDTDVRCRPVQSSFFERLLHAF